MSKLKFILVSVLIMCFAGLFQQRHSIACETIDSSRYEQIAPNVFASSSVINANVALLNISEGRRRVNSVFGNMESNPRIILVGNVVEASKFGANATATTHMYSPLGTCIVLGLMDKTKMFRRTN